MSKRYLSMKELSLYNSRVDKRYDVREVLGRGSYAEVFLATDTFASANSPHSKVVIKALNVRLQDEIDSDLERTLIENFQNEAVALDRVRHPNIISRLGHGTARDLNGTVFHYLVLEYLSGGDLQGLVRREKVTLQRALGYLEQICAGIGFAHKKGIIHRDIKPQNLLLMGDMTTVKIADFGVARDSDTNSPITRVGTNIYAPPEHSPLNASANDLHQRYKLTAASDIYSLAKSFYTILFSEAPRNYVNRPITALPVASEGLRTWDASLLKVLSRATSDDPNSRPQTAEEFWADLAEIRAIASDEEIGTVVRVRNESPQPHVSRGYSPIAPKRPEFESSNLGRIKTPAFPAVITQKQTFEASPATTSNVPAYASPQGQIPIQQPQREITPVINESTTIPRKRKGFLRRAVTFMIVLLISTGMIYGTINYLRGVSIIPVLTGLVSKTATANTDINLRPSPSTDNDPVGLVTRNSRLRIIDSRNNWYQVDVIQQGRDSPNSQNLPRGWLNGKYIDMDN